MPVVGDTTSAAERAADPAGWALPPAQRAALYGAIASRRDVRRFRPDAVPDELLRSLLAAAHAAPSVGHSQPWRFVVVRDPATRERAALCAEREQLRQAALLEEHAGRQLLDLQLHGIRDAPVGLVVGCDRRVDPVAVLGRATFGDADLWSCACAIENLWLAARAEGLGVGWVTLFQPDELAALVGMPEGVATLGWLCIGWPDERPPAPGLERAGWSQRQPLDAVVFAERWPSPAEDRTATAEDRTATAEDRTRTTGRGTAPAPPPGAQLRAPGPVSVVGARDEVDELLSAPGSLGSLGRAVARLRALQVTSRSSALLVLAAADHPVTEHGVSTFPPSVTREVLEAAVAGEALGAAAARAAGAAVLAVDAGVLGGPVPGSTGARPAGPRGDLVGRDAMTATDAGALLAAGQRLLLAGGTAGLVLLGEVGIGNTTVAAALWAALADLDGARAEDAVGLGASGDSPTLRRKRAVVRAALERARAEHGGALAGDPLVALAALGGPELAVLAGAVLGAAGSGAAVVLDGMATSVAALVAVRLEPAVAAHLVAGHVSSERAHRGVLEELGLEPLLDLRLRAGEGVGAALATAMLRAALATQEQAGRVAPPINLARRPRSRTPSRRGRGTG